jgi:CheY-like chemotaxis protein
MKREVEILLAEDDEGHAGLIQKNLIRAGVTNPIRHFRDGQETLDFLENRGPGPGREPDGAYILLLDVRMPKVDGIEVLRQIKNNRELRRMPVIMVTTTDDPRDIESCHDLGCSNYITKPIDYESFITVVRRLGYFLTVVEIPRIESPE